MPADLIYAPKKACFHTASMAWSYYISWRYRETSNKSQMCNLDWAITKHGLDTLTCRDWVKSSTLWPCLCHIFSRDSMTIIFPERLQYPKWSSSLNSSSGTPFRILGPPEKRSGWLQIFLRATSPEKIYTEDIDKHVHILKIFLSCLS